MYLPDHVWVNLFLLRSILNITKKKKKKVFLEKMGT